MIYEESEIDILVSLLNDKICFLNSIVCVLKCFIRIIIFNNGIRLYENGETRNMSIHISTL